MISRLGLAVAVAVLTALAVSGRADEALTRIVVAGHSFLGLVALAMNVMTRRRLQRSIERIRGATPEVADMPIEAPPIDVAGLIERIRPLAFDLAGAIDMPMERRRIRTWVLLESGGDTWVEIGYAGGPIAVFLSEVAARRLVETSFPTGATIDHPRLLAAPVVSSPSDALAAHREIVAGLGGSRRSVTTLDDYLVAERDQRAWTGGMRIREHLERVIEPSIRDWGVSVAVDVVAFAMLFGLRAPG